MNDRTNGDQVIFSGGTELLDWRIESRFTKEPETIAWIKCMEDSEPVIFIDVGSKFGMCSLISEGIFRSRDSACISIKPLIDNYRHLLRGLESNPEPNIWPLHAGCGTTTGLATLTVGTDAWVGDI